jgi:hypothetical protein
MPAWQKRQPSVQPRAISIDTRSNTVSVVAIGPLFGNGYWLMFEMNARWIGSGSSGRSARATYCWPVVGSVAVSYRLGT